MDEGHRERRETHYPVPDLGELARTDQLRAGEFGWTNCALYRTSSAGTISALRNASRLVAAVHTPERVRVPHGDAYPPTRSLVGRCMGMDDVRASELAVMPRTCRGRHPRLGPGCRASASWSSCDPCGDRRNGGSQRVLCLAGFSLPSRARGLTAAVREASI